jgi:2-polyprenyl-6-methoxyphenol hydroxylase-like FAD-dependent oxidoreductase
MSIAASRIAIVGGGTAGAASALFLARAGHRVTVFERVPEPTAIGAGILLQPTGMRVLQALGLLDEIIAHGARIEKLYGTTPTGKTVLDVRYRYFSKDSFGLGLHRGALFSVLWNAVKQAQIEIRTGVEVTHCDQQSGSARLFSNDMELGEYDCVIVANGTHSRVRDSLNVPSRVIPYPWGALWAVVPDDGTTSGMLRQWLRNAEQMLGLMPTGRNYGDAQPVVSFFWSLPADSLATWREQGLQHWKETVLKLAPVQPVLDHIKTPEQLTFASYADVQMTYWHDRRAVCIGDCAHATSPQLGQGANLALVDAMTLAQCFEASDNVQQALQLYSCTRKSHLRYYQSASRLLTPLFQSHSKLGSGLRDFGMGLVCRTPFLKQQMSLTLSGTKTGWVFGRLRDATPTFHNDTSAASTSATSLIEGVK